MAEAAGPRRRSFRAIAIGGSIATHALIAAWLLLSAHPLFRLPAQEPVQITLAPRWLFEPAPPVRLPQARATRRKLRKPGAGPAPTVATASVPAESAPAAVAPTPAAPASAMQDGPSPGSIAALRGILGSLDCLSPGARLTPEQRARCKPLQADPQAPAFRFQGPKIERWDRELAERHAPAREPFVPCPLDMPGSNFGVPCINTKSGPRQ